MLRGISISSTWFTCSGTILIRRATDAPLATLKSAVSFDFLNGGEGEDRRFNLAHHHQLTYKPIFHHQDRLTNRFQVIKGHFSGELRRCYRAPVGFVFLWPFTALAGQWRRQTDSPAQCAVVIGFMGPCGDRRQQFLAAEGTVVPSRRGDRRHCWPSLMPWPMPHAAAAAARRA